MNSYNGNKNVLNPSLNSTINPIKPVTQREDKKNISDFTILADDATVNHIVVVTTDGIAKQLPTPFPSLRADIESVEAQQQNLITYLVQYHAWNERQTIKGLMQAGAVNAFLSIPQKIGFSGEYFKSFDKAFGRVQNADSVEEFSIPASEAFGTECIIVLSHKVTNFRQTLTMSVKNNTHDIYFTRGITIWNKAEATDKSANFTVKYHENPQDTSVFSLIKMVDEDLNPTIANPENIHTTQAVLLHAQHRMTIENIRIDGGFVTNGYVQRIIMYSMMVALPTPPAFTTPAPAPFAQRQNFIEHQLERHNSET